MAKDKDSVIHVCSDMSSPPYLTAQTSRVMCTDSDGLISPNETVPTLRRSARARRAPDKLDL